MYTECVTISLEGGDFGGVCENCRKSGHRATYECKKIWADDNIQESQQQNTLSTRQSEAAEDRGL